MRESYIEVSVKIVRGFAWLSILAAIGAALYVVISANNSYRADWAIAIGTVVAILIGEALFWALLMIVASVAENIDEIARDSRSIPSKIAR